MNLEKVVTNVSKTLNINTKQVQTVIDLLADNHTIPFIARYRKEATGGLDENQIFDINQIYEYEKNLEQKKEDVVRLIEEKGLLTPEIKAAVLKATKLVEVENIYAPFKEGKKTKASIAKELGLEPLAKAILQEPNLDLEAKAKEFLNDEVTTTAKAIELAQDIIAFESTSKPQVREEMAKRIPKQAIAITKVKKSHDDENGVFKNYYDYSEKFDKIADHRLLGINRAVNKKVVTLKFEVNEEENIEYLYKQLQIKDGVNKDIIIEAVKDGYKRLLLPTIERAMYNERLEEASKQAIELFATNLENLLMTPPLKGKIILGFDPGIRTGCKIAIIDQSGNLLHVDIISPFVKNADVNKEGNKLAQMIKDFNVEVVAIGNGTASRESEEFVAKVIETYNLSSAYAIVSEIGASVYSASKIAQEEYPQLPVEKRSAISIARRLLDPLSELIKIDPKSIGVGQYQHDVNQKSLQTKLDFTVEKIVNEVGVDLNTASPYLLSHISGLNNSISKNIEAYRRENGNFQSRAQLKKVAKLGPKAFEQSAGFLRIDDGKNPLDATTIHPESYDIAKELIKLTNLDLNKSTSKEYIDTLKNINKKEMSQQLNSDEYTIEGIIKALLNINHDVRESLPAVELKKDVMKIDDLAIGMKLQGVVRNVVDFGAFVDIGLKNDGLVHISELSNKYVKHPSDIVAVNDIVNVNVIDVDKKTGRVSLSMKEMKGD